jgi:hypothetical protein
MRIEDGVGPPAAHAWWLVVKLLVVPAVAWGLVRLFGIQGVDASIVILCAALPTASNAYILAVRMTGDGRAVAAQITMGTVISMATLPIWMSIRV